MRTGKQRACFLKTLEYHLLMFCNVLAALVLIVLPPLPSPLASIYSTFTNREDICVSTSQFKRMTVDREPRALESCKAGENLESLKSPRMQAVCRVGSWSLCQAEKRASDLVATHCVGQVISSTPVPASVGAGTLPACHFVCPKGIPTYIETVLTTTKTPQGPWPWLLSSHRPLLHRCLLQGLGGEACLRTCHDSPVACSPPPWSVALWALGLGLVKFSPPSPVYLPYSCQLGRTDIFIL